MFFVLPLSRGKIILGYSETELCMKGSGYQFIHAADMMYCADNHVRSMLAILTSYIKYEYYLVCDGDATTHSHYLMQEVIKQQVNQVYFDAFTVVSQ